MPPQSVSLICVAKSGRSPGDALPSSVGFGDFLPTKKPAILAPGLLTGTGGGTAPSLVSERYEREVEREALRSAERIDEEFARAAPQRLLPERPREIDILLDANSFVSGPRLDEAQLDDITSLMDVIEF